MDDNTESTDTPFEFETESLLKEAGRGFVVGTVTSAGSIAGMIGILVVIGKGTELWDKWRKNRKSSDSPEETH